MAASDPQPRPNGHPPRGLDCLTPAALRERLEEEISRAERQATGLSCLLVVIDNLDELARAHGGELREQTLEYVADALRRELRRYDRVGPGGQDSDRDLLIILPGTHSPQGEIVARRALQRLHAIKVEAAGTRRPLEISVGLAVWSANTSAEALLASARTALCSVNGENGHSATDSPASQLQLPSEPARTQTP
jgi:diguanylate cyclase (GGDEF)-like protein